MSDERDETRQFSPFDDATQVGGPPAGDAAAADQTRATPVTPRPARSDPAATTALPPVDDWAASRGNPAWAGRAEVRAPRPGGPEYADDDWPAGPIREPRDRWWMPIVIGIVTLVLLGALGWGIYLIVQNSGSDQAPAPAPASAAVPQPAVTTGTAAPTTEPTTTAPTTTTATTPTTDSTAAIKIPALKGRSLAEAQSALGSVGLSYRLIYRSVGDAAPDTVIDSDPLEGQEVPPDTRVTLVIAARPQSTPPSSPSTAVPDQPDAGN